MEDLDIIYESEVDNGTAEENYVQNLNGKLVPIDEVDR